MAPTFSSTLKSALLAGAAAGLFAPLLWPLAILADQGRLTEWSILPSALLTVATFALLGGIAIGLLIGFPVLLLLRRFSLDRPSTVVLASMLIGVASVSGLFSWPPQAWPLYGFTALLSGLCGVVAVWQKT